VTDDLVDSIPEDFGDEEEVADDEVDDDMTEDLSEELGTEKKFFRDSEPRLEEDDDIMRSW